MVPREIDFSEKDMILAAFSLILGVLKAREKANDHAQPEKSY